MGEDAVIRAYQAMGYSLLASRWRGTAGEIDLIVGQDSEVVFVEVKQSSTHDMAAARIGRFQMDRICRAALEYCGGLEGGSLSQMRFDAALVDGYGRVEIIENAFGAD
ncbi:YraN family protein [Paracoccus sp. MBLB3053]|uniref:YraN family protein n=1 Tax=Paracoccus aurantius TaxID=3073814 RepID=A0ABU2HU73_9RHOB|nr:YraN family protein [Paracoccus sp. MBLB3053]MDS9468080.1 YraN family protein [Paracoccus sp. MBLB3053]